MTMSYVMVIYAVMFAQGPNATAALTTIPGYQSQERCEAARGWIDEAAEKSAPFKAIHTACIPGPLVEDAK